MQNDIFPFQITYMDHSHSRRQWSQDTRLFFILAGSADVYVEKRSFQVQTEDIFLINANDSYQISGASWEALVLSFRPDRLSRSKTAGDSRFDLCSAGSTYRTVYDYIRHCIAQLANLSSQKESFYSGQSIFYALYSYLITNFSAPPVKLPDSSHASRERLSAIVSYMEEHYKESLTLNETAEVFGLSSPYLSAFFKKHSGKSFMEYYNEIRLSHTVEALLSGTDSIESVALSHGFRDSRAFTALFRKHYGMLPHVFRKRHQKSLDPDRQAASTIPSDTASRDYPSLRKYLSIFQEEAERSMVLAENPRVIDAGSLSFKESGKALTHNYHKMICVGSAKQFLYSEVQEMLRRVQKEIRFEFVKFHGLLSDDMMVYSEDADHVPHYSFTLIDKAIDFMLSIGLRPLCQLSFMPIALAKDPHRLVDFYHYNTSPPKDMDRWTGLVDALVRHLIRRYGFAEVKTWLFCVWNEPDETVEQFAWDNRDEFFEFYRRTWQTVKSISPDLIFGTPSLLISVQKEQGWAGDFFQYTVRNQCLPDFLNIHYYDNSLFEEDAVERVRGEKGFSAENMERSFPLTSDPYAFTKFINNLKALMRKHNMRSLPIYLTEWNLTISHRDLINDTCFKSCHLVKNLLENYDRLSSYSYWCLTDFVEELQVPSELYHGGLGLFTYNQIPKANYNAFLLLGYLGNELLGQGDGYFITKKENGIAILFYNYEHYSRLFASGYRSEQNDANRYAAFEELPGAQFVVRLTDLPFANVLVKERFVNQSAGSSYDAWAKMGLHSLDDPDDLEILMQQSRPGIFLHRETVSEQSLTLHVRMAPLEIRLVEVVGIS